MKKASWYSVVLVLIFGLGIGLRFWHLRDNLMFQGDQGRDALIAKRILKDGDLALVGPVTSVGNMYLGPFYYYFMVPFLALTYPDPVGPAYGVALTSVLGMYLFYRLCRRILSPPATLLALAMYTFSAVALTYSRFSWNPNLAPLFGTLLLWCLYNLIILKKTVYVSGTSLCFAVLIQLHYMTLLAGPVILLLLLHTFRIEIRERRRLLLFGLGAILIFLLSLLPLFIFNSRHHDLILESFTSFFSSKEEHLKPLSKAAFVIDSLGDRSVHLLSRMMGWPENVWLDTFVPWLGFGLGCFFLFKPSQLKQKHVTMMRILLLFIVTAIVGTAFYSSPVFDHYLLFMLPILVLFYALGCDYIMKLNRKVGGVYLLLLILGLLHNLPAYPSLRAKPAEIDRYRQVALDTVIHLPNKPYNLALLSATRDYKGMNYRYFFETTGHRPLSPDEYQNLETLVVIDEIGVENPLAVSIFEIQASPQKQLLTQFVSASNTKVFVYQVSTNSSVSLQ